MWTSCAIGDAHQADKAEYQQIQYFNRAARQAMFAEGSTICQYYRRRDIREKTATYTIVKDGHTWDLNISDIKPKIFNTGVAMLIFETEYFANTRRLPDGTWKPDAPEELRRDVRQINEFPQIQGIEVYEKLQQMLFIDRLEKNIQHQLNDLYEIAEAEQAKAEKQRMDDEKKFKEEEDLNEKRQEKRLTWFGAGIGLLAVISGMADSYAIFDMFGKTGTADRVWPIAAAIVTVAAFAAAAILWGRSVDRGSRPNTQRHTDSCCGCRKRIFCRRGKQKK